MRPALARALAHLARQLRRFDARIPMFERIMRCELPEAEAAAMAAVCQRMGHRFGAFYAWKMEQMALISTLRSMDRKAVLSLVAAKDGSDYSRLDATLAGPGGLLVALPHHGHFVLSIIGLCKRLQGKRGVSVFYDAPEVHASNGIFDVLHACLFGAGDSGVAVLHNNRAGIVGAMKALRAGQVVVIMPDVYRNPEDTYQIPFCGSRRNVMLGSATLARRSGARILPMVSRVGSAQFEFSSVFGSPLDPHAGGGDPVRDTHADFRTTLGFFSQFEPLIEDQLLHWQYAARHVAREPSHPPPSVEVILAAAPMLLADPRIQVNARSRFCLDEGV